MRKIKHTDPEYLLHCGILEKWHGKTIHDFIGDSQAKEDVIDYVESHKKIRKAGIGLYLHGTNGSGKTLLMNIALMKLMEVGYKVRAVNMSDLITQFTEAWYDNQERVTLRDDMIGADYLGIDDIGKEYGTGFKTNPLAIHVLDNVLRTRLQRMRPTLITTNTAPQDVRRHYTPDISSMLNECCLIITVDGSDYRKRIQDTLRKKYL